MLWIIGVMALMHRPLEQILYFVPILLVHRARKSAKKPMYKYHMKLAVPLEGTLGSHR